MNEPLPIVRDTALRLFLAAPFTQDIDPDTGVIPQQSRHPLAVLAEALRMAGYSVFVAHEREAWGEELMSPQECTPLDFKEMADADVVCAYVGNPPSMGVHVELGWASAMGKPVLLLTEPGLAYTPLLLGIGGVTRAEILPLMGRGLAEMAPTVCERLAGLVTENSAGLR